MNIYPIKSIKIDLEAGSFSTFTIEASEASACWVMKQARAHMQEEHSVVRELSDNTDSQNNFLSQPTQIVFSSQQSNIFAGKHTIIIL